MTEQFQEKFEELMSNEDFRNQLKGLKERESIKNLFSNNGLELSDEVLDATMNEIKRLEETGELDENALEFISGGWSWGNFAKGALAGACIGYLSGGGYGAIAGVVIGAVVGGYAG